MNTHETHLKLTEHSRSLGVTIYASVRWTLRVTMACAPKVLCSVAQGTGNKVMKSGNAFQLYHISCGLHHLEDNHSLCQT